MRRCPMRFRASHLFIIGAVASFCVVFSVLKLNVRDSGLANLLRDRPALPSFSSGNEDQEPASAEPDWSTPAKENSRDLQVLLSKRNPYGYLNAIDAGTLTKPLFNPAILELPRGSKHEFVVIGRLDQDEEKIRGKKYQRARQAAFFANQTYDKRGLPVLKQDGEWYTTLVDDFLPPEHSCDNDHRIDQYIGPEDMRLYWTKEGAPLLIFTNQLPKGETLECEGMFLIDARAALAELDDALGPNAKNLPPIEFDKPQQLRQPNPLMREKNWAPFQAPFGKEAGQLFFSVNLKEPRIFKYEAQQDFVQPIAPAGATRVQQPFPPHDRRSAVTKRAPGTCVQEVMETFKNDGYHQATPIMSMTLCKRGECTPDIHNTVLFGLIHGKRRQPDKKGPWSPTYEPRIITWNATSPFAYRSVSKRLSYHGTTAIPWQWAWTGSIVYHWDHSEKPGDRSHGYLDDEVWLSFGIDDVKSGWMDVDAVELVWDHYYCQEASQES